MPTSFFVDWFSSGNDDLNTSASLQIVRMDKIRDLRSGPLDDINDLEAAIDLTKFVHKELERYATDGQQLASNDESEDLLKCLRSLLRRVAIEFNPPFRNFESFRDYWIQQGLTGDGSWSARRSYLYVLFEPVHQGLYEKEERSLRQPIASPVGQTQSVSWEEVDQEIRELRRKYDAAVTPQDYRALGTNCIGVFEAVGRVVFDPEVHLQENENNLPDDRIKERIDRFVASKLPGSTNIELRSAVNKSIVLANRLKHRRDPSAQMAGIACDATILLASVIRRLSDVTTTPVANDEIPF